jgi:hypothetical protein
VTREIDAGDFTTPGRTAKATTASVPRTLAWLERYGVGLVLVATGIAMGTTAIWARIDNSAAWSIGPFLGLLGFAAILVTLGWLYQLASLWTQGRENVLSTRERKAASPSPEDET